MNPSVGDKVIITASESGSYFGVGELGVIKEVRLNYYPVSAVVEIKDGSQLWVFIRNLDVLPPEDAYFQYKDMVKVNKLWEGSTYHLPRQQLLNQSGYISGWDKRDQTYQIDCGGSRGWFPLTCLVPIDYIGDKFFYPNDVIIYEKEKLIVQNIKKTKLGTGQLLRIRNEWVPSSEVSST